LDPISKFSLSQKTYLVTGAAGQIGTEIVNACLVSNANVIACDVDLAELERIATKEAWPSDKVAIHQCDITKREQVKKIFLDGSRVFGRIDGLINNAGVSTFEPFLERTEESFDWVTSVNLKGTFLCIQEYVHYVINAGSGGCIVNIASHYGVVSPDPRIYTDCDRKNSEVYGATKAGVIQMTKYFAVHLAEYGIRVNCIAPGGVRDPDSPQGHDFQKNYSYRCPMGRMAETSEIVWPIIFLLMPAASYINGQTLVVDGGTTAW
jgi:3-oxoacyl-[acyl-carrier protein] reductase